MSEAQAEIDTLQRQLDAMRKDLADRQHTEKLRQEKIVVLPLLWPTVNCQVISFLVIQSSFRCKLTLECWLGMRSDACKMSKCNHNTTASPPCGSSNTYAIRRRTFLGF